MVLFAVGQSDDQSATTRREDLDGTTTDNGADEVLGELNVIGGAAQFKAPTQTTAGLHQQGVAEVDPVDRQGACPRRRDAGPAGKPTRPIDQDRSAKFGFDVICQRRKATRHVVIA